MKKILISLILLLIALPAYAIDFETGNVGEGLLAYYRLDDNGATTTVIDDTGDNTATASGNTSRLSTASIGEEEPDYVVSGDGDADGSGSPNGYYFEAGVHETFPYYEREDGAYFIFAWDFEGGVMVISKILGSDLSGDWEKGNPNPPGVYSSTGSYSGTATVDAFVITDAGYSASLSTVSGKWDEAFVFDGTTDEVDCGSDFIGTTALSISAWIYPTGWGELDNGRIVNNAKSVLFISTTSDNLRFTSNGGVTQALSATNGIVLNTWSHVAISRTSAGVANLYINGALSGTADQDSGTIVGGGNVLIGNNSAGSMTFDGYIDNLMIWNRVLGLQEIEILYNAGRGTTNLTGVKSLGRPSGISYNRSLR